MQRAGLVDDGVGDRDLADVMKDGGVAQSGEFLPVDVQSPADRLSELPHAREMVADARVVLGQRAQ